MLLRRSTTSDPRIELIPLIDVLMFLLAFFLVAMTVAIRVEILPMNLRPLRAAEPAKPRPATTISIGLDGSIAIDRAEVKADDLVARLQATIEEKPETVIYLAVADGQGRTDRAPILQDVFDRLKDAGLSVSLVGRPSGKGEEPAPEAP